jgi:hypothetical protein
MEEKRRKSKSLEDPGRFKKTKAKPPTQNTATVTPSITIG